MQEYENFRDTIQKMRKKITYLLYKVISFYMKNRKCFFNICVCRSGVLSSMKFVLALHSAIHYF